MSRQVIDFSRGVLWSAAAVLLATSVFAGPMEEARALYNAGKYGEVDAKLSSVLDKRPVPMEALRLSFDASVKAGRPYTAERRYNAMLEKGEKLPSDVLYNAAMVAGQIGKPTVRRDRLVYFLNNEKGWNDNVEAALAFICRDGGDAGHFVRYMEKAPATPANFQLGMDMLAQMRSAKRTADYIEQVGTLLDKFRRDDWRTRVLADCDAFIATPPYSTFPGDLFATLVKFPLQNDKYFLRLAQRTGGFNAPLVIDFCNNNKTLLPAPIFARARNLKTDLNDVKVRDSYGPKLKAIEGLVTAANEQGALKNPDHLQTFIETIVQSGDVFRDGPAPLYTQLSLAQLFAKLATAKYNTAPASLRSLASMCIDQKVWSEDQQRTMLATYPKLFDYRPLVWDSKMAETARKTRDLNPTKQLFAKLEGRHDVKWGCLAYICELGDAALAKQLVEEEILTKPLDFDADNVVRHFVSCEAMTPADKTNSLKGLFAKTGYTPAWDRLVKFAVNPIKEDSNWKSFVESVKPEAKGADPLRGSLAALWQLKPGANNVCPPEAFTFAEAALKAYNGTFPDQKRPKESPVVEKVFEKMNELCKNKNDHDRFVKLFIRSVGKGGPSGVLLAHARDSQNVTNSLAVASALLKAGAVNPEDFAGYQVPQNFQSAILSPYYKDMTAGGAAYQVWLNCQTDKGAKRWPDDIRIREINALLDAHPVAEIPPANMSQLLDVIGELALTNSYVANLPLEKLAVAFLDQQLGPDYLRARAVVVFRVAGKADEAVARYIAGAKKLDPASRFNSLLYLCGVNLLVSGKWFDALDETAEKEEPAKTDFAAVLRDELLPALKAVPRKSSPTLSRINQNLFTDRLSHLCDRGAARQPEDVHKANLDFCRELAVRSGLGLQCAVDQWRVHVPIRIGFDELRKLKHPSDMAVCAYRVGETYATLVDYNGHNILAVLEACKKDEIWEPAHIVSSRVNTDNGALNTSLQRIRSDCSTHMPGIYPVDESNPLYPLYVAADELERNNPERSWALFQENIQTFEREAGKLPPTFVAWGVEQLRRQRGKNDVNLIKARQIATKLLANEKSLTPELAASLLLTKAECFRDQRNYEAARLEYQSIRNGSNYKGTKAARQAMFRDVDLLIEMGNVSQAESLVEYWISQPDVEIRAQAHYFLARIAFERKDFEETRKQLDSVFELDFTHTDARLLHGKWKLATNNEVDDTDVMIGDIVDRTIIRPGQNLKISVSDRNLGVAGDGASIPIVITTQPGGDVEVLTLYPSARVPYIFNGAIPTALGPCTATNRVLEVCGNDEVSYRIAPEFLADRGLTTTGPKNLHVVDDARLAIGAAAPIAKDGKAEADLERRLLSTNAERERGHQSAVSSLKPGNPIYVVVRDRDRSVTTEPDVVYVEAKTSSGDKLDAIVLKETGGSTGVFRGTIPTALPPPRAFASDTATGSNPCDTINGKPERNGTWKSVADGKQGKWLEVDTMGSHCISNVAIMLPNASVVKSIRLTGMLLDESVRLGSFPQEDINGRFGISYQVAAGSKLNSAALIRTSFSAKGAVAPKKVQSLAFTPVFQNKDAAQNAFLSAPMQLPAGQKSVRFHLQAKDTKGRTLAGLWMAIAVDGATVFTGQGNSLHNRTVDIDFTPGAHQLEMFFSASYPDDALDILVEDEKGQPVPFPSAWTDPKTSPDLAEFVKDSAVIRRMDKNAGFQASFTKPVRVRSLRWEFLDYVGREVEVKKLYIQDTDGKLIIPVETDYSDALQNETLEVAPGDTITVTYIDERTSSGETRIRENSIDSSFTDAQANFFFEKIEETGYGNKLNLYDAYRFIPGDMLLLSVIDPDGDLTPEADKVVVRVSTRSGQSAELSLVEQNKRFDNIPRNVSDNVAGIHGGHFLGQLRTCEVGNTNAPASVLRIAPGDAITLSYMDRENTNPGIPVERTATVMAAQPSVPELTLFDTSIERVEDTSYDAKLRLGQIRRRPGNEKIEKLYRDRYVARAMAAEVLASSNAIPVNVATPLPILVTDSSRARHSASTIRIEAVAGSELEDAENTGRAPETITIPLNLGHNFPDFKTNLERVDASVSGTFSGVLKLRLGPPDPSMEIDENAPPELSVNGNDTIRLRVLDEDGKVQIERQLRLCSAARLALMDSSYSADRNMAHVGERFFIQVTDPDQDTGEDLNEVQVDVTANPRLRDPATGKYASTKVTRKVILKETLPHSGVFTGVVRPVLFASNEEIPAVATGGVVNAAEEFADDRIAVSYGDTVHFVYNDEGTIPGRKPGPVETSGKVFKGSDGSVRLFSKRFRDPDMAILVQFRLAECLFESAKEHRRQKQPDKSAEAIEEGKFILEEALRNYPTTSHITQGEFLLANLYHELGMEQREAAEKAQKDGDEAEAAAHRKEADKLFAEALSRFSLILGTWPDSEFAPRAQYHKALCLEMLGDYNRSSEEYVKMTYLYPESPLVGDASIRLATYYYVKEQRYDTAGRIYSNFQKRFPTHEKADRALFMSAQCHMKQAEALAARARAEKKGIPAGLINDEYAAAVAALDTLIETYRDTAAKSLIAQAMYWAGDASLRAKDYEKSFLYLKRTVFEYPETEWARRARGLLLQEATAFEELK